MGLSLDSTFIAALAASETLTETLGGRIYGTAIPLPEADAENVPLPYAIVTFDRLDNGGTSKDNEYEGDEDEVSISIEVAASTLCALHDITQQVRDTVRQGLAAQDGAPTTYDMSAGAIAYDSAKPCYWQTLQYKCLKTI